MHRCTSTYNGAKLDQPAGVCLLTQHESTLHSTVLHPIDQLHTDLGFGFGARVYLPQAALAILSRAWILITHKHWVHAETKATSSSGGYNRSGS